MAEKRVNVWVHSSKRRHYLQLQWFDPRTGLRKSKSAETPDRDLAERRRADLEYELNNGLHREPNKMTWEQFHERYAAEKLAGLRPATRKKAGYVFNSFGKLAHPKNLGVIDERLLSQYSTRLRSDGRAQATIQAHLAYLKAALRWAADQNFIPRVPKFVMPKVPKKVLIRKIGAEEYKRLLLATPDYRWHALVATAWYTGMRRNEMLDLRWSDEGKPWVDFDEKRVRIPAAYNKADADQRVPLHPDLAGVLLPLRQPNGRLFEMSRSPREVSRKFGGMAKAVGLTITLHDLGRSFGSRYASKVPAAVLQRLMRHGDIKSTLAFYTDIDVLDEAILKA